MTDLRNSNAATFALSPRRPPKFLDVSRSNLGNSEFDANNSLAAAVAAQECEKNVAEQNPVVSVADDDEDE